MLLTAFRFCILSLLLLTLYSGSNGQDAVAVASSSSSQDASSSSAHASSSSSSQAASEPDPLDGYRIVCLYNNKKFYKSGFRPSMIDPKMCTHINYEFATLNNKTLEMEAGDRDVDIKENMYAEAVKLKEINPNLKVLLSIGGWEDSTKKYSDLVGEGIKVENFIDKAILFLRDYKFDGLDVAWEYPNCWQGRLGVMPTDKKNFAEFLEKIRKRFDKEGLILSISVGALKREIEAAYDVPVISKYVDHINVMTYDMHGPWEHETGHHTQMGKMEGDKDPLFNSIGAIEVWTGLGIDRKKLNLGTATYAKTFTLADPNQHGLRAPTVGGGRPGNITRQSGFLCFYEVCTLLNEGVWKEDEHQAVGFYAYSGDQWACYDSPMMVVKKAKWAVDHGLGGMLIKDVSCDDYLGKCYNLKFPLINMIRMEMESRIKKLKRTRGK